MMRVHDMVSHRPRAVPHTLDALRGEIDEIDDALLDLIERRVSASASIAALKQAEGDRRLKLRPRREAEVVARLTSRARAVEPEMIGHVWRTLMSCGLQTQAPMQLVLCGEGDRLAMQDRTRARFGPAARLRWAADQGEALEAARDAEVVAVIAAPVPPEVDGGLRVFDSFPAGGQTAYAVGRIAAEDVAPREPGR